MYFSSQVKKELKKLDKEHTAKTGLKRCWFVDRYEGVVGWLQLLERPKPENHCINTYAFSTMYTTLNLNDLVSTVSRAVKEAYGDHHRYLLVPGNTKSSLAGFRWEDGEPGAHYDIDGWLRPSDVINLVRVFVSSTSIPNGSRTRKQVKGLLMGTNPAPHLADTHCYDKGSASMDTLSTTDLNLARALEATDTLTTRSP